MSKFSICAIYIFLIIIAQTAGIMFHLKPNERKCLREAMAPNELLLGEYLVHAMPGSIINYIARDSKGQLLSQNQNVTKGRYTFSSDVQDTYEICFFSNTTKRLPAYAQIVSVNSKKGIEAKELIKLADQRGQLNTLEMSLKQLEYYANAIVSEFLTMHTQENFRTASNERINRLVSYLNVFCMIGMLALAVWQVFYLFKYFKAKKLID